MTTIRLSEKTLNHMRTICEGFLRDLAAGDIKTPDDHAERFRAVAAELVRLEHQNKRKRAA